MLSLLSSLVWGFGDFCGGTATRKLPAQVVVLGSQGFGLVLAAVAVLVTGSLSDPTGYLPWAVGAGLVGVAGLLLYYQALATGTMGVVSPIASLGVVVPVAIALATGRVPSAVVVVGIVLAVGGILALSGPERSGPVGLRPTVMAAGAAVFFGFTIYFIAQASTYSPLMTMLTMRLSSVIPLGAITAVLVRRRTVVIHRPGPSIWVLTATAGAFDVTANLLFGYASTLGSLAIVAVLGSLYPGGTVLLARFVHGERLHRIQQVGVVLALVGVALIAGGT